MAKDSSFDIECQFDMQELRNAVDQAKREILTRYDFKAITAEIDLSDDKIIITTESQYKLEAIKEILQSKLVKRSQSPKILDWSKTPDDAASMNVRQEVPLVKALDSDQTKAISKLIKASGEKVKANIQGESVRVSSPKKDVLQKMMQLIKESDIDAPLSFTNYR